jgi:hypothetical protein
MARNWVASGDYDIYVVCQSSGVNNSSNNTLIDFNSLVNAIFQEQFGLTLDFYPSSATVTPGSSGVNMLVHARATGNGTIALNGGTPSAGSAPYSTSYGPAEIGGGSGGTWGGFIYEVVLTNRLIQSGEEPAIEAYFAARYGAPV